MVKIDLGRIGAALAPARGDTFFDAMRALEDLGYATIWLSGGQTEDLGQITDVVRATKAVRVASAVLAVVRFDVHQVDALYRELEADHPGRFVVGLGGAHGPDPIGTLTRYLEQLSVPRDRIVLAALGPRMRAFGREHAAGILPILVTPEYTAQARADVGDDITLAIEQLVVFERDPDRARALARVPVGFLGNTPAYQANFRRLGFTDDDIASKSDRLVDALVAWGDAGTIAERVHAHLDAGADHVAISLVHDAESVPVDQWRALASELIG
jgi:probable F420-dependent oxidoreductase